VKKLENVYEVYCQPKMSDGCWSWLWTMEEIVNYCKYQWSSSARI